MTFSEILDKAQVPGCFKNVHDCVELFDRLVKERHLMVKEDENSVSLFYKDKPVFHIYQGTEEDRFYPVFDVYITDETKPTKQGSRKTFKIKELLGDVNDPWNTMRLFFYSHCEAIRICKQIRFLTMHVFILLRYVGAYTFKLDLEEKATEQPESTDAPTA